MHDRSKRLAISLYLQNKHDLKDLGESTLKEMFGEVFGGYVLWVKEELSAMEKHFSKVLEHLCCLTPFKLDDPNLVDTPKRLAMSYLEMFAGLGVNMDSIANTTFPANDYDNMVILKNIEFTSVCSHHFKSINGHVSIGYLPSKDKVLGVSKLARIVDIYAKRPQIQEQLTNEIMYEIIRAIQPRGVGVVIEAQHNCISSRGVEKKDAVMVTSAVSGEFRTVPTIKEEFLKLIKD